MADPQITPEQEAKLAAKAAEQARDNAKTYEGEAKAAKERIETLRKEAQIGGLAWATLGASIVTAAAAVVAICVASSQLGQIKKDARFSVAAEMSDRILSSLDQFSGNAEANNSFNNESDIPYSAKRDLVLLVNELVRANRFAKQADDPEIDQDLLELFDVVCRSFNRDVYSGVFDHINSMNIDARTAISTSDVGQGDVRENQKKQTFQEKLTRCQK